MAGDATYDQQRDRLREELRSGNAALAKIERLLVARRYDELAELGIGRGMSAAELRAAIERCGRTLCVYPASTRRQLTIQRSGAGSVGETVTFSMWTVEDQKAAVAVTYVCSDSENGKTAIAVQSIELQSEG